MKKSLQHRIFQQPGGILGSDFLSGEVATHGEHLGQPFGRRRLTLRWKCRHDSDERSDHAGIEWIVLRQNSARPGELPQLKRVDVPHGYTGCEQGTYDAALVAAAGLDPNCLDRRAAQLLDQFSPTAGIIPHRGAFLPWQDHYVEVILRHINTAEREHCHLRTPFLLMRARAPATVRVWKKRLELQAHSRFGIRGDYGLPVATGRRS